MQNTLYYNAFYTCLHRIAPTLEYNVEIGDEQYTRMSRFTVGVAR